MAPGSGMVHAQARAAPRLSTDRGTLRRDAASGRDDDGMRRTITLPDAAALLRSRRSLLESGTSDRALARGVASGVLHRVRRGWFVLGDEWDGLWPEGKHLLHVLATSRDARGSDPVYAGCSAAVLHGLPLYRLVPQRVEVIVANPRHIHSAPDVLRHEAILTPDDVTSRGGIRVTTLDRTVVDLARAVPQEAAVAAADAALRRVAVRRHVQDDDLAESWRQRMARQLHDARGRRGIRRARWTVAFADGRAQLPGESVSRVQLHRLGVRNIDLQVRVPAPDTGAYWVDFGLEDFHFFGEFDGEGKYTDEALRSGRTVEQVLLEEKYREDWIRGTTGRGMARWGDQHAATPTALAARLRAFGIALA